MDKTTTAEEIWEWLKKGYIVYSTTTEIAYICFEGTIYKKRFYTTEDDLNPCWVESLWDIWENKTYKGFMKFSLTDLLPVTQREVNKDANDF